MATDAPRRKLVAVVQRAQAAAAAAAKSCRQLENPQPERPVAVSTMRQVAKEQRQQEQLHRTPTHSIGTSGGTARHLLRWLGHGQRERPLKRTLPLQRKPRPRGTIMASEIVAEGRVPKRRRVELRHRSGFRPSVLFAARRLGVAAHPASMHSLQGAPLRNRRTTFVRRPEKSPSPTLIRSSSSGSSGNESSAAEDSRAPASPLSPVAATAASAASAAAVAAAEAAAERQQFGWGGFGSSATAALRKRRRRRRLIWKAAASTTPPQPASPEAAAVAALAATVDETSFQAAVLERLWAMCGQHEDAKVLAEYVVVMVAGNKGRDEMTLELKPFFQSEAQACSFVDWVEEAKWRFLTGGPTGEPQLDRQGGVVVGCISADAPRPASYARSRASAPVVSRLDRRAHIQRLPNAGTVFEVGSNLWHPAHVAAAVKRSSMHANPTQLVHAAAAVWPGHLSLGRSDGAPQRSPSAVEVRRERNELLVSMTRQLQQILPKLSDRSLSHAAREKYQDLAHSIQAQMAKLTGSQGKRRR
mmetsp:Transcript_114857/g.228585  ORF Transcript_114857/g.228585 Transcript_114857/m.228585 type:complete len:530 (-) Transcript_114857:118-1707(-)